MTRRAEALFTTLALLVLAAPVAVTGAEGTEASELQQLRDGIDWSDRPEPYPELVEEDGLEVYLNVTDEYLRYFFDKMGYTGEKVASGETTAVPPLFLLSIPEGWAEGKTVDYKKSVFYRVILPLILQENERILAERERLVTLKETLAAGDGLSDGDAFWLREMAVRYRVIKEDAEADPAPPVVEKLLKRVDIVPPSLALGQAAYESGYATSRFAHQGNALFGQWTWDGGMVPMDQRGGKGDYGIRAFRHPRDSVHGYFMNLNTHRAYGDFRAKRAQLRGEREGRVALDSLELAGGLLSYSERGEEYVKTLRGMIRTNRLQLADGLRLLEGDPIYFR